MIGDKSWIFHVRIHCFRGSYFLNGGSIDSATCDRLTSRVFSLFWILATFRKIIISRDFFRRIGSEGLPWKTRISRNFQWKGSLLRRQTIFRALYTLDLRYYSKIICGQHLPQANVNRIIVPTCAKKLVTLRPYCGGNSRNEANTVILAQTLSVLS